MINDPGSDDIIEYPTSSAFPDEKEESEEPKNPFSSKQKTAEGVIKSVKK